MESTSLQQNKIYCISFLPHISLVKAHNATADSSETDDMCYASSDWPNLTLKIYNKYNFNAITQY